MTVLITAGPTREPIDPVRYLTNKSSGRMGYALAAAAVAAGHRVILVSGPTALDVPEGVDFIPVESAIDMYEAVKHWIGKAGIGIFAAAVADYRPASVPGQKIKKSSDRMTLELVKNPDILASARTEFDFHGALIGFAAETEKLEEHARIKLEKKGADLIVANDVSRPGIGFDSEQNEILLVYPDRSEPVPPDSKTHLAHIIIEHAEDIARARAFD